MSSIKTPEQVESMREAGKVLSDILYTLYDLTVPGKDVWGLEEKFIDLCNKTRSIPACKGYTSEGVLPPFPTGLCVSLNNQSVHCYPKKGTEIKDTDIITIDTVIKRNGVHADASYAKAFERSSDARKKHVETAKQALHLAETLVAPGKKVGIISNAIDNFVISRGFNVLREYAGHGIGTEMHEDPEVPCYGSPTSGATLRHGMVICIETLVCSGDPKVTNTSAWETKMADGGDWAQFEHSILVTDDGFEILTPFRV